ncbi:MAG: hypothetical protein ACKPKO_01460, partial [Candidatus Fonsibacter sp.]
MVGPSKYSLINHAKENVPFLGARIITTRQFVYFANRTQLKVLTTSGHLVNLLQPAESRHQCSTIDKINLYDPFWMKHNEWSHIISSQDE